MKKIKSMFDNYSDKKINDKPLIYSVIEEIKEEKMPRAGESKIIRNLKDDVIGISVKENSKSTIYFKIDGLVEKNSHESIPNILRRGLFTFQVLNAYTETVYEVNKVHVYPEDRCVSVEIFSSENCPLKYGVYYMKLNFLVDGITYTLFSERDGYLSVE